MDDNENVETHDTDGGNDQEDENTPTRSSRSSQSSDHSSHSTQSTAQSTQSTPSQSKFKTILHPGEVNRIRELPQNSNILATHTDSPDVLIWDIESQPNRQANLACPASRPDLILTGHKDNAEFALAMCPTEPFVLSGGKDKSVILWGIYDHISTLAADPRSTKSFETGGIKNSKGDRSDDAPSSSPSVQARGTFQGHEDTVEDVQFCPTSAQEFCSVGDDSCLILWDARSGSTPVIKVERAHNADLHCVDWNPLDVNLILTGSADNTVRMFDRRNLTSGPINIFQGHSEVVNCVQWSPDRASVFGSAAEDGVLNIWDHKLVDQQNKSTGLFFRHVGHRDKVVDFHFNSSDPWTIVSVSDDTETGGGTLQIWRMLDLLYKPEEEALADLEKIKSHLLT
ncbi:WD-40 repeat-containing protein MSI4 [Heracleum sosnowskyi]|uniref:WD-40 repeat-containing protein MSI4 n=1 Tax=Heracleum sosnowskyi TaxID=360622 RepID=A0AAD8M365_9APIA|nr:WD-40 repeat-containing protein MSI4 [Heracleum sosnowskyi]